MTRLAVGVVLGALVLAGSLHAQGGPQLPQIRQGGRAAVAPFEMRTHLDLLAERQLAVVKGVQAPPGDRACQDSHALLASCSSARRVWRALVNRDLTAPTVTPSEKAISS